MEDWKVYRDGNDKPHLLGPEEAVKGIVLASIDRDELYIEDPDGKAYEEDRSTGKWVEIV
jgi:hypothetical protein